MLLRKTKINGINIGIFLSTNPPKKAILNGELPLAKTPREIKNVKKYAIKFFFSHINFLNTYLTYLSK